MLESNQSNDIASFSTIMSREEWALNFDSDAVDRVLSGQLVGDAVQAGWRADGVS